MSKIKVAIVGFGNIGKSAAEAVTAAADMQLAGIVRQNPRGDEMGIKTVKNIQELGAVDAALLCVPSREALSFGVKYLEMGINTVDSFDIHTEIAANRKILEKTAKQNGRAAVIAAGWDPGLDSVIRALLLAGAPRGITYTNFGPGMSMGHTVAVKAVEGVKDALSVTIPAGMGVHRRAVYVELEQSANFRKIKETILADPYFVNDETVVHNVPCVNDLIDRGHGVKLERKGVSGKTDNQNFTFEMKINNPALTAQLMVSCARASLKMPAGAYTMIEIPPIHLICGETDDIIHRIV